MTDVRESSPETAAFDADYFQWASRLNEVTSRYANQKRAAEAELEKARETLQDGIRKLQDEYQERVQKLKAIAKEQQRAIRRELEFHIDDLHLLRLTDEPSDQTDLQVGQRSHQHPQTTSRRVHFQTTEVAGSHKQDEEPTSHNDETAAQQQTPAESTGYMQLRSSKRPREEVAPTDVEGHSRKRRTREPLAERPVPQKESRVRKSIEFKDVFGEHFIVQFPHGSDNWYILYCKKHDFSFGINPIIGAKNHLGGKPHGMLHGNREMAVQKLGIRVLNCNAEKASQSNAVFRYVIKPSPAKQSRAHQVGKQTAEQPQHVEDIAQIETGPHGHKAAVDFSSGVDAVRESRQDSVSDDENVEGSQKPSDTSCIRSVSRNRTPVDRDRDHEGEIGALQNTHPPTSSIGSTAPPSPHISSSREASKSPDSSHDDIRHLPGWDSPMVAATCSDTRAEDSDGPANGHIGACSLCGSNHEISCGCRKSSASLEDYTEMERATGRADYVASTPVAEEDPAALRQINCPRSQADRKEDTPDMKNCNRIQGSPRPSGPTAESQSNRSCRDEPDATPPSCTASDGDIHDKEHFLHQRTAQSLGVVGEPLSARERHTVVTSDEAATATKPTTKTTTAAATTSPPRSRTPCASSPRVLIEISDNNSSSSEDEYSETDEQRSVDEDVSNSLVTEDPAYSWPRSPRTQVQDDEPMFNPTPPMDNVSIKARTHPYTTPTRSPAPTQIMGENSPPTEQKQHGREPNVTASPGERVTDYSGFWHQTQGLSETVREVLKMVPASPKTNVQERSASTEAPKEVVSEGSHEKITTRQPEGSIPNITYRDAVAEPEPEATGKSFDIQGGNTLDVSDKPPRPQLPDLCSSFPPLPPSLGPSIPENVPVNPVTPGPSISETYLMAACGNDFRCFCGRRHHSLYWLSDHQRLCSVARHDYVRGFLCLVACLGAGDLIPGPLIFRAGFPTRRQPGAAGETNWVFRLPNFVKDIETLTSIVQDLLGERVLRLASRTEINDYSKPPWASCNLTFGNDGHSFIRETLRSAGQMFDTWRYEAIKLVFHGFPYPSDPLFSSRGMHQLRFVIQALKSPLLDRIQEPGELSRVVDVCLSAYWAGEDPSSRDLCIKVARRLSSTASPPVDVDFRLWQLGTARTPSHPASSPRSLASEFTTSERTPMIDHRPASERGHTTTQVSSSVLASTAASALDLCSRASLPRDGKENREQQQQHSSDDGILLPDFGIMTVFATP